MKLQIQHDFLRLFLFSLFFPILLTSRFIPIHMLTWLVRCLREFILPSEAFYPKADILLSMMSSI
uniref:Uncharacterized protein n=1 Tax=Tetranychus urticae TaxID=32264 RepID=T1KJQ1_TETUR